jgi:hypothetical protein
MLNLFCFSVCGTWKSTKKILKDLQIFKKDVSEKFSRSFGRTQYQMKNSGVLPMRHLWNKLSVENGSILDIVFEKVRVSSGSIVSEYGLDDRAIGVRSPAGAEDFSSIFCVQNGSGAHPASCTLGTEVPFPVGKARPGRDADHSPPFNAEVENE